MAGIVFKLILARLRTLRHARWGLPPAGRVTDVSDRPSLHHPRQPALIASLGRSGAIGGPATKACQEFDEDGTFGSKRRLLERHLRRFS